MAPARRVDLLSNLAGQSRARRRLAHIRRTGITESAGRPHLCALTIDTLSALGQAAPPATLPLADWLIRKGLHRGTTASLIHGVSRRIVEAGVPL